MKPEPGTPNRTRPRIAVIDYGMGNLRSVARAVQTTGADVSVVTAPAELDRADGIVFPGQGAIVDTMGFLRRTGFDGALRAWIAADRPFLGVCLGLQALFEGSEEGGGTPCLGVFSGRVRRFRLAPEYKVPHMGWNSVRFLQPAAPVCAGLRPEGEAFYFVHSYCVVPEDRGLVLGETDYGGPFVCAVARGNCFATQFHPEKSQSHGLRIYRNFTDHCARVAVD